MTAGRIGMTVATATGATIGMAIVTEVVLKCGEAFRMD
jgi:hypothetical protein